MDLDSLVGRTIWDEAVPTPFVYVDRTVLGRNIDRMAEAARASGVTLRPHTKTHKLAEIARLQLDAGAAGLTVAKLGSPARRSFTSASACAWSRTTRASSPTSPRSCSKAAGRRSRASGAPSRAGRSGRPGRTAYL